MVRTYILVDRKPVLEPDLSKWSRFLTDDRMVARWQFGEAFVSTMFIGVDFREPPLLFETMIFGGPLDGYQYRYETWEEAEMGHLDACERVRKLAHVDV